MSLEAYETPGRSVSQPADDIDRAELVTSVSPGSDAAGAVNPSRSLEAADDTDPVNSSDDDNEPASLDYLQSLLSNWLGALRLPEPMPMGLELSLAEDLERPDFQQVVGTLIALKQETSLQARTFKELARQVDALRKGLGELPQRLEEAVATQIDDSLKPSDVQLEAARAEGRLEGLGLLMDLRDRLERAIAPASSYERAGRFTQLIEGRSVVRALVQGVALCSSRIEDALAREQLERFPHVGDRFDPLCMQVLEVEMTRTYPEGTVLEVVAPGYRQEERVIRQAQVRVSRHPGEQKMLASATGP